MNQLKIYVVSSHVDKPLEGSIDNSKYEIHIQAGAALTDKRICELNDHDGFKESISDKNRRLAEGTAIYWVYKHIDADYIGIEHYRRRFTASDSVLEQWMSEEVDLITTKPMEMEEPLEAAYIRNHYGGDWVMMMELLKKYDPKNFELYQREANNTRFHFGNINIMKADLFREYCDWVFPIVEDCLRITPEKWDSYNARDVAFLMERLTHFFVMRVKKDGKEVRECEVKNYSKHEWEPQDECDLRDFDAVYNACERLYKEHQMTKCSVLLWTARQVGADRDERLQRVIKTFSAWIFERNRTQSTMCEYLPLEMKNELETLCSSYEELEQVIRMYMASPGEEMKGLFTNYVKSTGYSQLLLDYVLAGLDN